MGARRRNAVKTFCLLAILIVPATILACFQVGQAPATLQNKDIKVRFTFDGKPLGGVPVSLWSHKRGTIAKGNTDSNGWFVFKGIPAGDYKVELYSPSRESVSVVLDEAKTTKTAMSVNFFGDWCQQVSIVADKS
jgi:hypothetical protein